MNVYVTVSPTVADAGPGIPRRYRETVFRPFERLADRSQRTGIQGDTGTGLGLSIVRAIALAHGGDAECLDRERGTAFRMTLDVDPMNSPTDTPNGSEGAA